MLGYKSWDEGRILFCSQRGSRHAYWTEYIVHVLLQERYFPSYLQYRMNVG